MDERVDCLMRDRVRDGEEITHIHVACLPLEKHIREIYVIRK